MRCQCCDKELSDYEATIKDARTGVYPDMCVECIKASGISSMVVLSDRPELNHEEEVEQEILEL